MVDVVIDREGNITFAVAGGGDFETAKRQIQEAIAGLQLEGVDFVEVGEVERHRHDQPPSEMVHAHDHTH